MSDLKEHVARRYADHIAEANKLVSPDVAGLVEALDQCVTSMLDSGYRADAVVIRAARAALAAHRKQEPEP